MIIVKTYLYVEWHVQNIFISRISEKEGTLMPYFNWLMAQIYILTDGTDTSYLIEHLK